ncbi:ovomucoid-like [Ciona intestinalis]
MKKYCYVIISVCLLVMLLQVNADLTCGDVTSRHCTRDRRPVCGGNGAKSITYSNKCEYCRERRDDKSWKILHDGEC